MPGDADMRTEWQAVFSQGLLSPQVQAPFGFGRRRYDVYRNNVTVGLVRALEANFPVVRTLLGPVYFAGFARAFTQSSPPLSRLMFEYGEGFPEALAAAEDLAPYPYLADVARLETAWRQSFHAVDAPPLDPVGFSALAHQELENVRLVPHPALRLLRSNYAVGSIFSDHRAQGDNAHREMKHMRPDAAECVVVARAAFEVRVDVVPAGDFALYEALLDGERFGVAAEKAEIVAPGYDLGAALARALSHGYFSGTSI